VEEAAARWVKKNMKKPVVRSPLASPPRSKRMGHSGAIISDGNGTAQEKFPRGKRAE
jgi:succinyl-CoA synthetase alpha subunit